MTRIIYLLFMVWYATSSVATISSRIILHGGVVRPQDLLVTQLVLSLAYLHLLGILGIVDLKISKEHISALKHFLLSISVVYVTGFLLLQKGLQMASASFAVTCRGFEPVITCVFSLLCLSERVHAIQWFAVFLIIVGVGLCAGSDKSWSIGGLLVLVLCNISFSLRSLIVKVLHTRCSDLDLSHLKGVQIYYATCFVGSIIMLCLNMSEVFVLSLASKQAFLRWSQENYLLLAVNSICFTVYNVSSYILLGKIQLSYHAVGNAVRQGFVILASIFFVGSTLTADNTIGIMCVVAGAALYASSKTVGQVSSPMDTKTSAPSSEPQQVLPS